MDMLAECTDMMTEYTDFPGDREFVQYFLVPIEDTPPGKIFSFLMNGIHLDECGDREANRMTSEFFGALPSEVWG